MRLLRAHWLSIAVLAGCGGGASRPQPVAHVSTSHAWQLHPATDGQWQGGYIPVPLAALPDPPAPPPPAPTEDLFRAKLQDSARHLLRSYELPLEVLGASREIDRPAAVARIFAVEERSLFASIDDARALGIPGFIPADSVALRVQSWDAYHAAVEGFVAEVPRRVCDQLTREILDMPAARKIIERASSRLTEMHSASADMFPKLTDMQPASADVIPRTVRQQAIALATPIVENLVADLVAARIAARRGKWIVRFHGKK